MLEVIGVELPFSFEVFYTHLLFNDMLITSSARLAILK